ncbi:ABC transporter permease [Veronia pacifica]|uniref:NAD synthetase n=1 Tax=Veronia pacifica TaxID=1080227 RepID=A0A1C3EBG9_9GAMM|nr:ABC transporter permease [Veronia pacifica]ODA30596.1 NAD synthetase [Veronia pacifica]
MTTAIATDLNKSKSKSERSTSPTALIINRFFQHRAGVLGGAFLLLLIITCFCAPLIQSWIGHDPFEVNFFTRYQPVSAEFWLGSDELGRDVFLRLLYAGQISLAFGFVTAVFTAIVGTSLGIISGYFGGKVDGFIMRWADFTLSLPVLPLLIVVAAIDLEKLGISEELARSDAFTVGRLTVILCLFGWPLTARLVRSGTLSVREREYVKAAQGYGASSFRIITRHVLPNVLSPVIVATTMGIGLVILTEAALSFLGFGIQPPTPSWGNMLTNAKESIWQSPTLAIFPGLAIVVTVMAFNFLGDALQDALDPKSK